MRRSLTVALAAAFLLSGCSAQHGASSVYTTAAQTAPAISAHVATPTPKAATPSRAAATTPAKKTSFSILDDLMFETISAKYGAVGVPLDRGSYDRLSDDVCTDMRKGGDGYFTIGDVSRLSESGKQALARSMWLVFAQSCYPVDYVHSDSDMEALIDSIMEQYPEYQRRLQAAGLALSDSGPSSAYTGAGSGYLGSDYSGAGSSGSGYSTTCKDGTVSQSGGKRGACSWHGGVSK